MMKRLVFAAAPLIALLAACAASSDSTTREKRPTAPSARPATSPSTATLAYDPNNPTHDPNRCVQVLSDGTVIITIVQPVPPDTPPNPAAANEPITPVPPLGTCG
jgi:hypothetical protein